MHAAAIAVWPFAVFTGMFVLQHLLGSDDGQRFPSSNYAHSSLDIMLVSATHSAAFS